MTLLFDVQLVNRAFLSLKCSVLLPEIVSERCKNAAEIR